jgi:hypothetical protein
LATVDSHGAQLRNGGQASGGGKGKGGGNKVGSKRSISQRTNMDGMQDNYLAYCASDGGKDTLARRGLNPAPAHYSELRELNPPLQFMNASGKSKPRITSFVKQSKSRR